MKTLLRFTVITLMVATTMVQLTIFGGIFPSVQQYEGVLYAVFMLSFLGTIFASFSNNVQARKLFNSLVDLEQQLVHGKRFSNTYNNQRIKNDF